MKSIAAVLIILSTFAMGQSPAKNSNEPQALRADFDRLVHAFAKLEQDRDYWKEKAESPSPAAFRPISASGKTFTTEEDFVAEYNNLVKQFNELADRYNFVVSQPVRPVIIQQAPARNAITTKPVYCNATSYEAGGLTNTQVNCQ